MPSLAEVTSVGDESPPTTRRHDTTTSSASGAARVWAGLEEAAAPSEVGCRARSAGTDADGVTPVHARSRGSESAAIVRDLLISIASSSVRPTGTLGRQTRWAHGPRGRNCPLAGERGLGVGDTRLELVTSSV